MTLLDVFNYLALGPLANTGDVVNGMIKTDSYQKFANFTQLGLRDIYTRFPLKDSELILDQDDGTVIYYLNSKHAYSNTESTEQKYIDDDDGNEFTDDILAITAFYDEAGCLVPINDNSASNSYYTPTPLSVQIPTPVTGNSTFVQYRADHPKLSDVSDPSSVELELPEVALSALLCYVTWRAYMPNQSAEAQAISMNQKMMYEEQLLFLQKYITVNNISPEANNAFHSNGWV
ncbi:head completion adaptor [Vibrio virus vB_VspP_SBP1]|uniref:Head completion adaptor n=1 Tax=Vibrio virus vB_VspP_SBP1 TaxID=2500581 RepID=A0A3T0IIP3_9CAUD|nr:virion structural protein [Vibrio virus vB_VspP_SBP1]AZU99660.1 head completion adaptor [Vibrio virus vB_VspP_SBP1]